MFAVDYELGAVLITNLSALFIPCLGLHVVSRWIRTVVSLHSVVRCLQSFALDKISYDYNSVSNKQNC